MPEWIKQFKWENDAYWWELLRFDEFGLPASLNFAVPDKLFHFLACFGLAWLFSNWTGRYTACFLSWFIMMVPWELIWDGCFRYGASWRDMIANTLGVLVFYWFTSNPTIGQSD
jgi:hypothetical protein